MFFPVAAAFAGYVLVDYDDRARYAIPWGRKPPWHVTLDETSLCGRIMAILACGATAGGAKTVSMHRRTKLAQRRNRHFAEQDIECTRQVYAY